MAKKSNKRYILPVLALVLALAAILVVLFFPRGNDKRVSDEAPPESSVIIAEETAAETPAQTAAETEAESSSAVSVKPGEETAAVFDQNEDGDFVIYADRLSASEVSFIRLPGDSRIELLARLGDDGAAKAALGTCQSCNGAPGAYYNQEGDVLRCNNCGLTFPISVLDSPGGGCHPIMLDEGIVRYEGDDIVIDAAGLSPYEGLFEKVEEH